MIDVEIVWCCCVLNAQNYELFFLVDFC